MKTKQRFHGSYAFALLVILCAMLGMICLGVLTVFAADAPPAFEVVWSEQLESVYGETHTVTAKYFDGEGQEYTATITGFPALGDGEVLDAGTYELTAEPEDSAHTLTNDTVTYTVTPKTVSVVWSDNLTVPYGAATEEVSAYYPDAFGGRVPLTVYGMPATPASGYLNAGYYALAVTAFDANYIVENTTAVYRVTPAEVEVTWDGAFEHTYGESVGHITAIYGDGISATIQGQPDSMADAGIFVLTAVPTDGNYIFTNATHVYTVNPKHVTVSWSGLESIYGDALATVTATCTDGVLNLPLTLIGVGEIGTDAGEYPLSATLDDSNYILENATATYTVHPKRVSVVWGGAFASDHGADMAEVTVSCMDGSTNVPVTLQGLPASGAEAGGYVLTATTADENYVLEDATRVYVIREMQVINDLKTENAQLKNENEQLESENEQLEGQNSVLTSQNTVLQNKISVLETQVGTLSDKVNTLTGEITALRAQNNNLSTQNSSLSTKVNTLQSKIEVLTAEIGALETDIATLTGKIGTMNGQLGALEIENGKLKQEIVNLQAKLNGAVEEIAALREKIASQTGEIQSLQGQTTLLQDGIGELKKQDKLKVVAIIILAAALLVMIVGVTFYLCRKNLAKGTASPSDRAVMTENECRSVGKGLRDAILRSQDICEDIVARNQFSAEYSDAVRRQFKGWENMVIRAMQDYRPEVGEVYDRYSMIDASDSDKGGRYVSQVLVPGKRVGNYIVFPAKVITDETV